MKNILIKKFVRLDASDTTEEFIVRGNVLSGKSVQISQ